MSKNNCGCGNTQSANSGGNEFLLVKATGSNAGTCGDINLDALANENCSKQEPMFDFSKSDFIIPLPSSITQMEVCNSDIYAIEMWLQFLNPIATLKISNITGNILTLQNRCPDGSAILTNPDVGAAISRGTRFVVCDAPVCQTNEDNLEAIQDALESLTELCLPALQQSSRTAVIHPVGRVESDSANSSAGKCLKRIYGFLFKGGIPVLSKLALTDQSNLPNFRRIVKDKTTNEISELKNYSEYAEASNTNQKALSVMSTGERLVGPIRFVRPFRDHLYQNTTDANPSDWPLTTNTEAKRTIDISGLDAYTAGRNFIDNIHCQIQVDVSVRTTGSGNTKFAITCNDVDIGQMFTSDDNIQSCSFTTIVKIVDTDKNLLIKINGSNNFRCRFKVDLLAYYL